MITMDIDPTQIAKLKDKFEKYPPYALGKGLDATSDYLNSADFKNGMYPPSQSGQPFIWSSDRQRRAFFASNGFGGGIPTRRTYTLLNNGSYKVDKKASSLYVYYENATSYAKWVIGNFLQIIGHKTRGWKPENTRVVDNGSKILPIFKDAVLKAWDEMSGQAPGL